MLLILGILLTLVFLACLHKPLKKHPNPFYWAALGIDLLLAADAYWQFSVDFPDWVQDYALTAFTRGSFATALFFAVMFIGALDGKNKIVRTLYGIRAEMSIVASILTLGHNAIYGYSYFPILFTNPSRMRPEYLAASIVTVILILLLIPLFVTSFPGVRRKMSARGWKKLQRLAYPFYYLIYVHVLILFLPRIELGGNYLSGVIGYTAVYALYTVLRLRKYFKKRRARAAAANDRRKP